MRGDTSHTGRFRPDIQQAPKGRTQGCWKGLGAHVGTCVRSIDHDVLAAEYTHVKADVAYGLPRAAEEHQVTRGQDGPGGQFRRGVVLVLCHPGE